MSYASLHRMKMSVGLRERLTACAAQEGVVNPDFWVSENLWKLVKGSDWVTAWEYAEDTMTINDNPDIGARDDVINDGMVLAAVQAVVAAQAGGVAAP